MKFNCPFCHVELEADVQPGDLGDCPNCGKEFRVPEPSVSDGGTKRFARCPSCGATIDETAKFCSACESAVAASGAPLQKEQTGNPPTPVAKETIAVKADQEEMVFLAAELTHLQYWGFNNIATEIADEILRIPFIRILVGLAMFFVNPVWWIVGPIFSLIGFARLEKGDLEGARRALRWGRCVNWAIAFVFVAFGHFALKSMREP